MRIRRIDKYGTDEQQYCHKHLKHPTMEVDVIEGVNKKTGKPTFNYVIGCVNCGWTFFATKRTLKRILDDHEPFSNEG